MVFKKKFTLEQRTAESKKILVKYPDKIPIIVENSKKSTLKPMTKNKFLVPNDLTLGQFLVIIRKRIDLDSKDSLFTFINDKILPPTSAKVSTLYYDHKDEDGFLYMTYCNENTFGNK